MAFNASDSVTVLRRLVTSLAFAATASIALAQPPAEAATAGDSETKTKQWFGTLDTGPAKLRLLFDLQKKDGSLQCVITSIDQGNVKIPCDSVTFAKGKLSVSIKKIAGAFVGTINKQKTEIDGTWTQAGQKFPLKLMIRSEENEKPLAVWAGTLDVKVQKLKLQIRHMATEDGGEEILFDSLSQRAMGIKADLDFDGGEVTLTVPSIGAVFKGKLNDTFDSVEGTWEQMGKAYPMTFKKMDSATTELEPLERPQQPKPPYPYREETVTFENKTAGIRLAGTLTMPQESGQYPAVVLVSGSGPQDRDESLMGHKPFHVIADYLTRRGVVVLRFDDRGVGESTGDFSSATSRDFATDAASAVAFLKTHADVDADRIGLVGHSEGGLIAPIVEAELDAGLAHFVMLSGPGVDGGTILTSQSEAMHKAMGSSPEEMARAKKVVLRMVQAIANNATDEEIEELIEELIEEELKNAAAESPDKDEEAKKMEADMVRKQLTMMNSPWFRFFVSYDPVPNLEKVTCPVLALNGSNDLQVLPELNLPVIEKALSEGGNQDFACIEMPGLNHLFQESKTGSPTEYQLITETFSPKALKLIADWVEAH